MTNNTRPYGGPAFPRPFSSDPAYPGKAPEDHEANDGMTLRDWFAGMALQGLMDQNQSMAGQDAATWRTERAYAHADAMLKRRDDDE